MIKEREKHSFLLSIFSNFKFLKFLDEGANHTDVFKEKIWSLGKVKAISESLAVAPKFILESILFLSLFLGVVLWTEYHGESSLVSLAPTVSLFLMALYRMLPSLNKCAQGINILSYTSASVSIVFKELLAQCEKIGSKELEEFKSLKLEEIGFSYDEDKKNLSCVNLNILAGDFIGVVGESGSGKTTLVDIISGILSPNQGTIHYNDRALEDDSVQTWRSQIGYIPQDSILFSGTVRENILFGRGFSDDELVDSLKIAKLHETLQNKNGLETEVGDSGCFLSGGQKQRVSIARAVCGGKKVIVLDEATSALDSSTENDVLEILGDLKDVSKIFITHKESILNKCNKIWRVRDGKVSVEIPSVHTLDIDSNSTKAGDSI